jgi:cation:H+ antiporter
MTPALLLFLASAAVVVTAGTVMARAADAIAERTGLGRLWVGVILLATATSLPELATDIAAVRLGAPNLGAGDLFGSSMANMLILALLGLVPPRDHVFQRAALDHALSASLAIVLNALGAVLILAPTGLALLGVGPEPLILLAVFIAGTLTVYQQGRRATGPPSAAEVAAAPHRAPGGLSLKSAIIRFGVAALVVVAVSPIFARSAARIAEFTGLGQTFIGTLLVGLSTSLPELVTAFAAARIGAFDLAVGNLFGSNAFNMVVFLPMELAHRGGPLFPLLDPSHALTAFFAVILMAIGLAAIVYRAERRHALVEPGSVLMVICYLLALWALYGHARR